MSVETISVPMFDGERQTGRKNVEVIKRQGVWAVTKWPHEYRTGLFMVTHVPTGNGLLKRGTTRDIALCVLKAAQTLPGDWTFTDTNALTPKQKKAGAKFRKRWEV